MTIFKFLALIVVKLQAYIITGIIRLLTIRPRSHERFVNIEKNFLCLLKQSILDRPFLLAFFEQNSS